MIQPLAELVRSRVGMGFDRPRGERGEVYGPCPSCGGDRKSDRFRVYPNQPPEGDLAVEAGLYGGYSCRQCGIGGDYIQYLVNVEGLNWADILRELGIEQDGTPRPKPMRVDNPPPQQKTNRPRGRSIDDLLPIELPPEKWREQAVKIMNECATELENHPEVFEYLAGRGVTAETARFFKLGYLVGKKQKQGPPAVFKARASWGLAPKKRKDGSEAKALWFPEGITIPKIRGGEIVSLRIRKSQEVRAFRPDDPGYHMVDGGRGGAWIYPANAKVYIVVEAELCALAILSAGVPGVGVIALGSLQAYPDARAAVELSNALAIFLALDFEPQAKSAQDGSRTLDWWLRTFDRAKRTPVPMGKDPGEFVETAGPAGLRTWIQTLLPPVMQMAGSPGRRKAPPTPTPISASQDDRANKLPEAVAELKKIISITGTRIMLGKAGNVIGFQPTSADIGRLWELVDVPAVSEWCKLIQAQLQKEPGVFEVNSRNFMKPMEA